MSPVNNYLSLPAPVNNSVNNRRSLTVPQENTVAASNPEQPQSPVASQPRPVPVSRVRAGLDAFNQTAQNSRSATPNSSRQPINEYQQNQSLLQRQELDELFRLDLFA